MQKIITEPEVEELALEILGRQDYEIVPGLDIAPDGPNPGRQGYCDVVLIGRLRESVDRLNSKIPAGAKEEAVKQVLKNSMGMAT